jgi:cellulose synthase/poly-beta-1,6-N-acetylglucosamine synthase-like glycosyltransferase
MFGLVDFVLVCVFVFFYVSLFYNLPILAAGVRDFRRYSKRAQKKFVLQRKSLPFFSLILPVKNERSVIERVLKAFLELNYPSDKFEVVIVDDGSTDGTFEFGKDFASKHSNIKFYHRGFSRGKACALNFGLANSRGDILAIFDADNVPEKDTLLIAAAHFRDKSVAALQGRIHSINSNQNMLTQFITYEDSVWCEAFLRGKESLGLFVHLRGCCQFIRRGVLEGLGGFDESIMAEDIEISARLVRKGHRIKYTSDIRTWQESPSTLKGFLKQRTRWYTGHMQVALKYGSLLKNLNRMTLDAEFTLILPFVAIASFICFSLASWNVFSVLSNNPFLVGLMAFSSVTSTVLFLLAGFTLVYYSRPARLRNLLWLPFVFGYWCLQSFLAVYAGFLILFKRPFSWVKTEKSGVVSSTMFTNAVTNSVDVKSSV